MYRYHPPTGRAARLGWLFSIALLVCCSAASARSNAPLVLADELHSPVSLYGRFEILVDNDHRHTLADLLAGSAEADFVAGDARSANIGYTTAQVWARFSIRYTAELREPLVLAVPHPLLDDLTLYSVSDDGQIAVVNTGDARPFQSRPYDYRSFAFDLGGRAGQTVTYYVRVLSPTSPVGLPLLLMSESDLHAAMATENLFLGGYFGILISLALGALILFVIVRDAAFPFYCLYLTAFALMMATISGFGMEFLWPHAPYAQQVLPIVLAAIAVLSGILYVRRFLELPCVVPVSDTMFLLVVAALVLGVILHLAQPSHLGAMIVIGTGVALCPLILVFCILAVARGGRAARFFLFGWLTYIAGVVATALDLTGYIAHTPFTYYGIYLGSLAEFVALALALCDRLNTARHSREAQIAEVNADLAELNANLERIVYERTQELEARNRELSELAVRDSLTGLYNHSTAIELLEQALQQSQRYEFPVATIMVDLDNFKNLNDSYGHQVGDKVLEAVSQTLLDSVRGSDIVGRYGGEEFLIVMPHADSPAAREYGERLLHRIRDIDVLGSGRKLAVSASVGISVFHPHGHRPPSAQEVIRRADEALYRSKRDGRDRLTVDSLSLVAGYEDRRFDQITPA